MRWTRRTTAQPDALGQASITEQQVTIWLNWMEVGGSERDIEGVLSQPITRAVAFARWGDTIAHSDRITLIDVDPQRAYEVVAVTELGNRRGQRIELELADG